MASYELNSPTARSISESIASPTTRRPRGQSTSSDRPSLSGATNLPSPPSIISPEPLYIAASAASQIVTNDYDSHSDTWFDEHGIEPSSDPALVSPLALKLVNRFLDQLLFNFLSVARSTSLASLRPAVAEVLKPKLAKDAIHGADQELQEYLGGGEDEELLAFHNGTEPSGGWDVELVWKRTRLRCMVYSSLGDMEEEDEDLYIEEDQLDGPPGSNTRFQNNTGVLSPAVAIFLTSILEFLGEQSLVVAGQAAYHRQRAKYEKDQRDGVASPRESIDRIVVEEADMERVALDRTLGRLWRGWKKRIRSPTTSISMSRTFSRESLRSRGGTSRRGSLGTEEPVPPLDDAIRKASITEVIMNDYHLNDHAANIPLPIKENDVEEIEVPGLAENSDDEAEAPPEIPIKKRSNSVAIFSNDLYAPNSAQEPHPQTPTLGRRRSSSLPSPAVSPYVSPKKRERAVLTDVEAREPIPQPTIDEVPEHVQNSDVQDHHGEYVEIFNEKEEKARPMSVAASVTAFGSSSLRGPRAETQGLAEETEDEDLETDEEEPEIMTSSRVSMGDRLPSEVSQPRSRPSSIHSQGQSVRLVDVGSPRSPASNHGSIDGADYITARPAMSRSGSLRSSVSQDTQVPRIATPTQRASTTSTVVRVSSLKGNRPIRNNAEESASESVSSSIDTAIASSLPTQGTTLDHAVQQEISSKRGIPPAATENVETATSHQFVLAAPPVRKSSREAPGASSLPVANAPASLKANGSEYGAPPLTPLREMMESAPDTSDETSSIAASYDAQSIAESYGYSPESTTVTFGHVRGLDSSTRPTPPRKSIETSKPRPSPPRASREDDLTPRPEDHGRPLRQIPTSGSSSSSIKSHKLKAVRTSEDSMPNTGEDKGRSFEQLIRSDQTIQYTLTPENVRNIEELSQNPLPPSPGFVQGNRPASPRSTSYNSINKLTSLNSNPPKTSSGSSTKGLTGMATSQSASNIGARVRPRGAAQARDARVNRDSLGDFADFIRSTGPPGAYDDLPPRSSPAASKPSIANGVRNASAPISAPTTNGVRSPGTPNSRAGQATSTAGTPNRSDSTAIRKRYEARDAAVSSRDQTSDLIDFIRQGPPGEKVQQGPRIPRTVAPFRDTMDSDQMSGAVGARVEITAGATEPRHSQASTNISNGPSTMSVTSSVNSSSALLNNHNSTKTTQSFNPFDDEDIMPKRKTRRVKDPYAIDLSDEEDEFAFEAAKPKRHEESLIEFLNNVPPPPDITPTVSFADPPVKVEPKKSSGAKLISRFARNGSMSGPVPKASPDSDRRPSLKNTSSPGPQTLSQFSVTKYDQGGTNGSNYLSQLDSERKPSSKVAQIPYTPRDATIAKSSYSSTNALADFLKNTTPPPSNQNTESFAILTPPPPPPAKDDQGSFSKMFSRKKKTAAA